MYYPYAGRGVAAQDVRDYDRVFQEIDGERRELADYAAHLPPLQTGFGAELACRREHLYDLTELEETLMIRTRYVDLEPHWRAHRRFQRFLSAADTREELLFCTDWLKQHESADDAEFRQWLRHGCSSDEPDECLDCLYFADPERILLSVKMQLF